MHGAKKLQNCCAVCFSNVRLALGTRTECAKMPVSAILIACVVGCKTDTHRILQKKKGYAACIEHAEQESTVNSSKGWHRHPIDANLSSRKDRCSII